MVPRLTDCGAWLASSAKEYIPNHAADYVDANAQTARMQRREMQQSRRETRQQGRQQRCSGQYRCSAANQLKSARWLASRECEMRNLWLACACCAAALAFSYSPPPEPSWLPSLGISHAAAQVFPGHYRRVARRSYRRAARYSAYVAGSTAGYYGNPYGYGYGGGFGGYSYGGYGGYAYPYSTSYYGGYSTSGVYRRAYRRAY